MVARRDSLPRLPLSCAITRPRRRASSAPTGSASRNANPYAKSAYDSAHGLRVASAASISGPCLLTATGERPCEHEACPGECMGVATACQQGATPLDPSFRLADGHIRSAKQALEAERHLGAATADHQLGGVATADSRLDSQGVIAASDAPGGRSLVALGGHAGPVGR